MEHLSNICPSKEHYDAMFAQRSLGGVMTLEGAIGRSIDVGKGSLMIRLTARGFVAGDRTFYAYEQMRLRRVYDTTGQKYVAAPIKRTYAYPFVAMLTISLTR
jgi:hypothetical protein